MKIILLLLSLTWVQFLYSNDGPEVVITTGHADQINAMVTSPDGRFLASAGNDKIIKIWEIATTQEYRTLSGMDGRIIQLIFASDNIHLAGITTSEEVIVWNVLTGEEKFHYRSGGLMSGVAFSADGKRIYHSSNNSLLAITELSTGNVTEKEVVSVSLAVDTNKQMIYSYDQLGNLNYYSLESESIVRTVKLFDEFVFPFSRTDPSPDGKFLATGFNDDVLRIYDTDKHQFIFESPKYDCKIKDLKFDPVGKYLYVALTNGKVQVFDYEAFQVKKEFVEGVFTAQCLTAHPKGGIVILANLNVITFYDISRKKSFKKLAGKVASIEKMAYDPKNDYLAIATENIKIDIWDLKLNKRITSVNGFFPCEFTPDGGHLIAQMFNTNMGIWNTETGALEKELNTGYKMQLAVSVSDDGKFVAGGGIDMAVTVWDLASGKEVAKLQGHTGLITGVDFHPTEQWVVSSSYDQTSKIWDFKQKKLLHSFTDQQICVSDVKFSPDGKFLAIAAWDKTIHVRQAPNWEIKHVLKGHTNMITSIDFNKQGNVLVSGAANNAVAEFDNSVRFWDVGSGAEICKIQDHLTGITQVVFDETNDRAFSSSNDGTVKINDYKSCEVVATYVAIEGEDFVIYTPDNYYMASKNALKGMAFRINNTLVPFEQFDAHLNRPDIVAERIAKSPPQLIKAYNYLYKKRLRKLNIEEGDLKLDYQIPHLINESNLDLATSEKSLKFTVKAWDDAYNIATIRVFVNDVPIFGEEGYLVNEKVKSIRKEFEVPLVIGTNKILISAVNSNGVESLYEGIEIIRQGEQEKHNLYVAAIGVSKYQDTRFNLTYPTKDAEDVVSKMKESAPLYSNVYTKLLLNEDVTIENFEALSAFFAPATHEDLAIIFIAGHGVLNVDFDYFFGTVDIDFDNPSSRGLSYDKIHFLLNRLKPYKKLLIMDTCHSGELDEEEIELGPPVDIEEGDVEFRNAGVGVRQKQGFGFDNSLEIMQDMFSDTRKGSGATVISSAGGAEFAMESDLWKNGLFTYTFLSGLDKPETDLNHDGLIQVSEIRSYVHKQVELLSKGKQIPSSREENISQDYTIFGR